MSSGEKRQYPPRSDRFRKITDSHPDTKTLPAAFEDALAGRIEENSPASLTDTPMENTAVEVAEPDLTKEPSPRFEELVFETGQSELDAVDNPGQKTTDLADNGTDTGAGLQLEPGQDPNRTGETETGETQTSGAIRIPAIDPDSLSEEELEQLVQQRISLRDREPNYTPGPQTQMLMQRSAQARKNRRSRRRKRRIITTLVIFSVIFAVVGVSYVAVKELGGVSALFSSSSDYEGEGHGEIVIEIPKGATGSQIGEILASKNVVKSADTFTKVFKNNVYAQGIQAGRYRMALEMSAEAALARMLDPHYKADLTITVPEGFTLAQVRERLISKGNFSAEEVDKALQDPAALGLPKQANGNLEGWLGADSYILDQDESVTSVLKRMVVRQVKILEDAKVAEKDWETVLIKASILEREASRKEDRGKVARVIENRLKGENETAGYLMMDSTILYGLGRSGGIPSPEEIQDASNAYNTYKHAGLPPTPIGSPGLEAIKAVLNPTPGDWLYFVTVNLETGDTRFAKTGAEHEENIKLLNQYCKEHANQCGH